jgi:serine/threonine protein kinase
MTETTCRCGAIYPDTRFSCPECRRPRPLTSGGPASAASTSASAPEGSDPTDDRLPTELRGRWRIVAPLIVDSAQAELFLVVGADADDPAPTHVLKRYRRDASGDAYERGQTLARLRAVEHVGVARIEDHDPDGRWELTEYIPGGTLADLIAERQAAGGRFEEAMTESVIAGLAEALSALHTVGVFHRDLKPSNVLVRSREPLSLALTDFGGAVGTDLSVVLEQVGVATPRYAPPEWFNATTRATGDVWPLGMIALELLAGHPFDGLESVQVQARLGRRPWPVDPTGLRASVDPASADRWEVLLRGTLHPDPEERWSAREVLAWTRGEDVRRPADPAGSLGVTATLPDGSYALTVAGAAIIGPRELARAIAEDRASWAEGREHLRSGRLRTWAREQLPELLELLDDRRDRTADPDEVLLEVLLTIDPMLPPSFRGRSLTQDRLPRLISEALRGDASDAPTVAGQLLRTDGPIRTIVGLGRGEEHAQLGQLLERFASAEKELREAWRRIGALRSPDITAVLPTDLRLTLLSRIVSPPSPLRWPAAQAAILRRPRRTRRAIRRSSPVVRSVLLDQIPPLPLEVLLGRDPAAGDYGTRPEGATGVARVLATAALRDVSVALLAPGIVARRWWSGGPGPDERVTRLANGAALPSLVLWSLAVSLLAGDTRVLAWSDLLVATSVALTVAITAGVMTGGFGRISGSIAAGLCLLVAAASWSPTVSAMTLSRGSRFDEEMALVAPILLCVLLLPSRLFSSRTRDMFVTLHRTALVASAAIVGVALAGSVPQATLSGVRDPAALASGVLILPITLATSAFIPEWLSVPGRAVTASLIFAVGLLAGIANTLIPRRARVVISERPTPLPATLAVAVLAVPFLLQHPQLAFRIVSSGPLVPVGLFSEAVWSYWLIGLVAAVWIGRRQDAWDVTVPWDPRLATAIAVLPAIVLGVTAALYAAS